MRIFLALVLVVFVAAGAVTGWIWFTLPDVRSIRGCVTTSMHHIELCSKSAHYVGLSQVSAQAINTIVASEDTAFYWHHGFDIHEIQQSMKTNLLRGGWARGGSTITQQLAKNVYFTHTKAITRKIKELILAWQMEETFSKQEILEKYLNVIELGPDLYGIKDAARFYFNKEAKDLNILEGAYFAYLLPNPKDYSSTFRKRQLTPYAERRIRDLMYRLEGFKKISSVQRDVALGKVKDFPWTNLDADTDRLLREEIAR